MIGHIDVSPDAAFALTNSLGGQCYIKSLKIQYDGGMQNDACNKYGFSVADTQYVCHT